MDTPMGLNVEEPACERYLLDPVFRSQKFRTRLRRVR
jgi:hypothetical protein